MTAVRVLAMAVCLAGMAGTGRFTSAQADTLLQGKSSTDGDSKLKVLRDAAGHTCLKIRSISRSDAIMPNTFQHIIVAENNCAKAIFVRVCYKNSTTSCRDIRTRPYGSETAILGTMTGYPRFDFEYDEHYLP